MDWITHTLSAAIIAAFVYGSLLVVPERGGLPVPDAWIWLLTVGSTLVVGVVWELVELVARGVADTYDIEPVLVQYGWRDTVLDLVFDGVGALLIVLLDIRLFVPVARQLPTPGQVLLLGGGVVLGTSTVLLVVQLVLPGESF